jgi:signal transduction histidine kinase
VGSLQSSGRVIAGGRLLLACLFLFAVWSDSTQPTRFPTETYGVLLAYVAWASALTLVTWRDWWLDARAALPAHVIDIGVFMAMLYSTEGYTSPYFTFFVFLLLAAAIRWGWRETAATAAVVILVYFAVGLVIAPSGIFDSERFIVRTGHLLILSAILIWFGSNQRIAWPNRREPTTEAAIGGGEPLARALRAGIAGLGARRGVLLWSDAVSDEVSLVTVDHRGITRSTLPALDALDLPSVPTLYDIGTQRALAREASGRWSFFRGEMPIAPAVSQAAELTEGLAIPIRSGIGAGFAFLESIPNLSTDHLEFGQRLGNEIAGHLQAAAILAAAEESSIAKARVSVARDLHDSVVQFLAGLGFRLEDLFQASLDGENVAAGLAEIKEIVIGEQAQLRAFIGALRTGGFMKVSDAERDIGALCQRLTRQWDISCGCATELAGSTMPVRLHLDIVQLVREGVANSVRHGKARHVDILLRTDGDHIALSIIDDGSGFDDEHPPASLAGRVKEAGGALTVQSRKGKTQLLLRLPATLEQ